MMQNEEYLGDTKIISVGKDRLSKYELEEIPKLERQTLYKVKEFIYYYLDYGYEGEGCAIFLDSNDKWHIVDLGHCSCYGPLEDLKSVPMEKEQVLELLKNGKYSYYDDHSNKLKYIELIDYLEKHDA